MTVGRRERRAAASTRFNRRVIAKVLEAAEVGATQKYAARYAGIHETTIGGWLRWGRAYLDGEDCSGYTTLRPTLMQLGRFYEQWSTARGKWAYKNLKVINQAAQAGDSRDAVRAAEVALKLGDPGEFNRQNVEVGGDPDRPIGHEVRHHVDPPAEAIAQIVALVLDAERIDRGGGTPGQVREIIDVQATGSGRGDARDPATGGDARAHRRAYEEDLRGLPPGRGEPVYPSPAEAEAGDVPFSD